MIDGMCVCVGFLKSPQVCPELPATITAEIQQIESDQQAGGDRDQQGMKHIQIARVVYRRQTKSLRPSQVDQLFDELPVRVIPHAEERENIERGKLECEPMEYQPAYAPCRRVHQTKVHNMILIGMPAGSL